MCVIPAGRTRASVSAAYLQKQSWLFLSCVFYLLVQKTKQKKKEAAWSFGEKQLSADALNTSLFFSSSKDSLLWCDILLCFWLLSFFFCFYLQIRAGGGVAAANFGLLRARLQDNKNGKVWRWQTFENM